jgi:hypothetical protein
MNNANMLTLPRRPLNTPDDNKRLDALREERLKELQSKGYKPQTGWLFEVPKL